MPATTIYLRFADRAAALAALAPFGLVVDDPDTGEASFAVTAWPEGVRVDLALADGSGTHWHQTGTITVEDPELGPMEQPVLETIPGFHVDLLWSDGTPPDFGTAAIEPQTPSRTFAA